MAEPRRIRIDGKAGFTGRIATNGYGSRAVRVIELAYGLGIISTESGESRHRRAFYPVVTTSSSFGMTVAFTTWEEREAFNRWITRYMRGVSTKAGTNGYMRIDVPSRRFERIAVFEGGIEYGEAVGDLAYTAKLDFCGSSDPIDGIKAVKQNLSVFRLPDDKIAKFYYPAGNQLSGAASLEGTIFDDTADPIPGPNDVGTDNPQPPVVPPFGEVPY